MGFVFRVLPVRNKGRLTLPLSVCLSPGHQVTGPLISQPLIGAEVPPSWSGGREHGSQAVVSSPWALTYVTLHWGRRLGGWNREGGILKGSLPVVGAFHKGMGDQADGAVRGKDREEKDWIFRGDVEKSWKGNAIPTGQEMVGKRLH